MQRSQWAEWGLVAAIIIAFIVIPIVIIVRPPALPFRFSFLILPMIPAIGLAILAVLFSLRRRERPDA